MTDTKSIKPFSFTSAPGVRDCVDRESKYKAKDMRRRIRKQMTKRKTKNKLYDRYFE